ncbi:MAG: hypothetical protein JWN15_2742 [Firmicutes bacterium]|nr:hypothetical protein [Bacillota bacterium]
MKLVGTAEVVQGAKTQGYLQVGSDTDGTPFRIPVLVVAGAKPGPTVWVHGCIHGEEYGGAASIIRLVQELDPQHLAGTLVGVPVTNLPSFKAHSRISPLDGANLNRIFPGNPEGTYSFRLAHALLEAMATTADWVLDFHSGGIGAEVPFYAIYDDNGSLASRRAAWLAERIGVDTLWRSAGDFRGTVTAQAAARGIPAVTVECGGGNVTVEHEEQFKATIRNALHALDMLPGTAPVQPQYRIVTDGAFMFTGHGGLFVPACPVGAVLKKGDLIGRVINLYGEVVEEMVNPVEEAWIAATGHRYWPTEPGQLIAEALPVQGRRQASDFPG